MDRGLILKLQFFMFVISASNACFSPFLPVYFNSRNLNFTEIGIAFSVSAIIGVVFQPIWGYISDKYLNKKNTLFVTIIANIIVIIFFIKVRNFSSIIFLIILNNIFMCGIGPITDAYTFDVIEEREGLSYSNFRFMSSAAWAITNLVLGYVIRARGVDCAFIIYAILSLIGLILLTSMKYAGKKSLRKIELKDVGHILKDNRMKIFFITVFLMNAAFIAGVNYMNELIKFTKGDVSKLGMVWFVTCTFEVTTFFFAVKLIKKLGVINVYLISIAVYGLKFIIDYILKNTDYIITFQALEGIAFTLFITSSLEYLNDRTEAQVRATAMSIYAAFGGFGAFSSSLIGGILLNSINPSKLYGIFGITCFVCLLFGMILKFIDKNNTAEAAV